MRLVAQQVLSLSWLLLWATTVASAQDPQPTEYQLKAAFLFNFAKFVDWPPEVFQQSTSPLVIGILGENPFGQSLERTVTNKIIGGHPLGVRMPSSLEEARLCHILFVSSSENKRLKEILDGLHGAAVLTVGETAHFIDNGGIINFVIEGQKIRFEINGRDAASAGLKISSKLLSLAARTTR